MPDATPCQCLRCLRERDDRDAAGWPVELTRMILCPTCGCKRCPHATDHRHSCTDSNEIGQRGSIYGAPDDNLPPAPRISLAQPAQYQPSDVSGELRDPVARRTRYRSEPGMLGHYPWTYQDGGRVGFKRPARPECEEEHLFTADQLRAAVAAERERCYAIAQRAPFEQGDLDASEWSSPEAAADAALKAMALDITSAIRGPRGSDVSP